jgi:hypothetical protein
MSGSNPTHSQLSPFGQCIVDKHYDSLIRNKTVFGELIERYFPNTKETKESLLAKQGIDRILDVADGTIIQQCMAKEPVNALPAIMSNMPKYARATRL